MEERAKRPGTLAHCLSFAGARRGLVVASLLLAALSAAASFVPFVAIYFVIADVVAAYPDLAALDAGHGPEAALEAARDAAERNAAVPGQGRLG